MSRLFFCIPFFAGAAFAQSYPEKPVRVIVPFPAGGTPAQLAAYHEADFERRGQVVKAAGIRDF